MTPDLPTTNSVPGAAPVTATFGGVTLPTMRRSVSGFDAFVPPSVASATTTTIVPIGTLRPTPIVNGSDTLVTAVVNVVSIARVTPPETRTRTVLSPRSSRALTANVSTVSAPAAPGATAT